MVQHKTAFNFYTRNTSVTALLDIDSIYSIYANTKRLEKLSPCSSLKMIHNIDINYNYVCPKSEVCSYFHSYHQLSKSYRNSLPNKVVNLIALQNHVQGKIHEGQGDSEGLSVTSTGSLKVTTVEHDLQQSKLNICTFRLRFLCIK